MKIVFQKRQKKELYTTEMKLNDIKYIDKTTCQSSSDKQTSLDGFVSTLFTLCSTPSSGWVNWFGFEIKFVTGGKLQG
jgi:hypothetical protein